MSALDREQRIAAMRARRQSPEFAAAGAQLVAEQRAAAERESARRQAEIDERTERYWAQQIMRLSLDVLDTHRKALDDMLRDVAADQHCSVADLDDGRAIEVCDSYVATLPITRRSAAIAIELYRCEFGLTVHETIARLAR